MSNNTIYRGRIKVVNPDLMCFPADPVTLEPLGTSCYDAYALTDPEVGPVETISTAEWNRRLADSPCLVHIGWRCDRYQRLPQR